MTNYRPVSLLSFLSKVLETVVAQQSLSHIDKHSLSLSLSLSLSHSLSPLSLTLSARYQTGFKRHHSTETALLKVTNDILRKSDRGKVLVLLDLSAAFDTIHHDIPLSRFEIGIGLSGVL